MCRHIRPVNGACVAGRHARPFMFAYCERTSLPSSLVSLLCLVLLVASCPDSNIHFIVLLVASCSDSNIHSALVWPHATCELPFHSWYGAAWQSIWPHLSPLRHHRRSRSNWYLQCNTGMTDSSTHLSNPLVNPVWLWNPHSFPEGKK